MSPNLQLNRKVLVIDDDQQYLKLTARILRDAGYDVTARSDVIGTSVAIASECPDVVLIDLNMPGLDGDRLALLIQQSVARVPLLVLHSGMTDDVVRARAVACHADATIPKGLLPKQFLDRVNRVFARVSFDRACKLASTK